MNYIPFNDIHKQQLFDIPLFKDLSSPVKQKLTDILQIRVAHCPLHDVIIEQGTVCNRLYVLLEGTLEVNIIDSNGNEVLIEHIIAPRAFATPHLFKEDNRFPATFKVIQEAILLTATKESTFQLISEFPEVLKSFLRVSGRCNICTTTRLDILSKKTIRERLIVYFSKYQRKGSQQVAIPHTLTQLADFLNVSRPALSTEFNKLEKEGHIRRKDKNRIDLEPSLFRLLD